MYTVYYSYVVKRKDGTKKESGSGNVEVNASNDNDAKRLAQVAAGKQKLYESGSYFSEFRIQSISKK